MSTPSADQLVLDSLRHRFESTKQNGDGALAQLDGADFAWSPDPDTNSIAVIMQHLHGNMMSRWTDFLTTDGEKPTRDRDGEFTPPSFLDREALLRLWEEGWSCLFAGLSSLTPEDLTRNVTIRGQELSVVDALLRQLAHGAYHVGQIVYIAKQRRGASWQSLSIPKNQSRAYVPSRKD